MQVLDWGTSSSTSHVERSVTFYRDVLGWNQLLASGPGANSPCLPAVRGHHHELLLIES